jgi:hypothetical protein
LRQRLVGLRGIRRRVADWRRPTLGRQPAAVGSWLRRAKVRAAVLWTAKRQWLLLLGVLMLTWWALLFHKQSIYESINWKGSPAQDGRKGDSVKRPGQFLLW